jgi:hypothetical protein
MAPRAVNMSIAATVAQLARAARQAAGPLPQLASDELYTRAEEFRRKVETANCAGARVMIEDLATHITTLAKLREAEERSASQPGVPCPASHTGREGRCLAAYAALQRLWRQAGLHG